jgi:hypothetical protein
MESESVNNYQPEISSVIIGNRANTLDDIFHYYYKHGLKTINISSNLTMDKKLAIFHDDVSELRMKHLIRNNILVLDEVLKNVPEDLTLNIEITRYISQKAKQNKLPNDIVIRYIMAVKKRGKKNMFYSSYDREIVRIIMKNRRESVLLIDKEEDLKDLAIYPKICIHKDLLPKLSQELINEKDISVHTVQFGEELETLKLAYPFVKAWVTKYDFEPKHSTTLPLRGIALQASSLCSQSLEC